MSGAAWDVMQVVIGLAMLTIASDHFVMGSARLAVELRVSRVVVGALVIGFGTSAPELFVSTLSALDGNQDLAAGNIVGSNLANLSLILGLAGLATPITISDRVFGREAPFAFATAIAFGLAAQGGISRIEGALLLAGLVACVAWIVRGNGEARTSELGQQVDEFLAEEMKYSLGAEVLRTAAGLVGTLVGAQLLVRGATGLAVAAGLGEGFVGLTLVAVGTSLPELVTALQAARKGEDELLVGNLLGSNIFNSLSVGGLVGLVAPGSIEDKTVVSFGVAAMILVVGAAWTMMYTGKRLVKTEALTLLLLYSAIVPQLMR